MINIAILGAGRIAKSMAKTINGMKEANLYGIASRSMENAIEFAKEFQIEHAYGSYEEMVKDPNIDLVYIATPHSLHGEFSMLCLEHGKHVLCEKAFTANAKQANEVIALAKEKKLLVTEAMWSRYVPMAETIKNLITDGTIGEVYTLRADFGARKFNTPIMSRPELAGGALLDLGIYPLTFAAMTFGLDIVDIKTTAVLNEHGVDSQHSIILQYKDNKIATLNSSMLSKMEARATVYGSEGYFVVKGMTNYESIEIYNNSNELIKTIHRPEQITGYEYEVLAAIKAINDGELECPQMPHDETIRMMELMDRLREMWGVRYPFD